MKIPLSWLNDFVEIDLSLEELARTLTMGGLEVEEIRLVGLPMPESEKHEFKISGLSWEADKIVVAQIDEVMPHPNADRLVLCRLNDGVQEHTVLTGAPNLYPYKGQGALPQPLKVAYAKEGARIYDGHQPGQVVTTLKRAKIRGVESYSMVCSEKELGISDEHEGVLILDEDAPTGKALVDYMGDAVFEISILPNMARNASVIGVAREIAALTGQTLRKPPLKLPADGPSIQGQAAIQIQDPQLNPRFIVGLVRGVAICTSPYWVQRRLRLAGMRPINSIVDATNYVMLETGQPLHAFDYDVLVQRAGGKPPTIITRTAKPGERMTTLDEVEHILSDFTVLVADTAGPLSLAGVMGGLESEVTGNTRSILLEGASWNLIHTRRTVNALRISSEAAYRFARGVHPGIALEAVQRCLDCIALWSGGQIAAGLVDEYPLPQTDPVVILHTADIRRHLGIEMSAAEAAKLLRRLEFECQVEDDRIEVKTPPHRLDIGEGIIGVADLIEEIARLYGYDTIPASRLADPLPPQRSNPQLEKEERLRDILAGLGLQEIITYRLTSPEREARALPPGETADEQSYLNLQNPIATERRALRRSLLASVLEVIERNARLAERLAFFEIGPVFDPQPGQLLPAEPLRLVIAISGLRSPTGWSQPQTTSPYLDFYDLKGIIEAMLDQLHIDPVSFEAAGAPVFHPGKCAAVKHAAAGLGVFGELHPLVKERYDLGEPAVLAAEFDMQALLAAMPRLHLVAPVPAFPPVLEDIAVILAEDIPSAKVVSLIRQAGGELLTDARLFDIYRGEQIGAGKKSLAYRLTYQASDRTLTDREAAAIRQRVVQKLEQELGARLRS